MNEQHPDRGYTLIEVLLVIVVIGLLATIVAIAAGGFTTEAGGAGCAADRRLLYTAVESYFMQHDVAAIPASAVPPASAGDAFEQTLVTSELLHSPSSFHDITAGGVVTVAAGSPCAT